MYVLDLSVVVALDVHTAVTACHVDLPGWLFLRARYETLNAAPLP